MSQAPYTTYASSVVMLAGIVTSRMNKKPIGTKRPRLLALQAPPGPSTQGGRAARQALMLVADSETAVCGWVDFVEQSWDLKNYDAMAARYQARFAKELDLTRAEYDSFAKNLALVFKELKLKQAVGVDDPSVETTEEHAVTGSGVVLYPPVPTALPTGVVLLIVALTVALGLVCALLYLRA